MAYESEFLIVKLGNSREGGFPRTTELMRGVNFVVGRAVEMGMPIVVNISFGNTYGSHDGTGLLEMFLDDIGNYGRDHHSWWGAEMKGQQQGICREKGQCRRNFR